MIDLHTHHSRCGHAEGELDDYARAAIAGGLHTLGLSDHSPRFDDDADHPLPGVAMAKSEFENYLEDARRLKSAYGGHLDVVVGVESEYFPEAHSQYLDVFRASDLDYVIGSVHRVDGCEIFNRDRWEGLSADGVSGIVDRYVSLVSDAVSHGEFDILGHADALRGNFPGGELFTRSQMETMFTAVAECGVVMEINTSGLTKDCGGWYPQARWIELAHSHGVRFTLGSDAHTPRRVGDQLCDVVRLLRSIDCRRVYTFRERRAHSLSI